MTHLIKDYVSTCECGVAAQINLDRRRKPTNFKAVLIFDKKCRFSQIILCCNLLHYRSIYPLFQWANGGWIAREKLIREGVYLVNFQLHDGKLGDVNRTMRDETETKCRAMRIWKK